MGRSGLSPVDLDEMEWAGERCFRVLDTYFTVRCEDLDVDRYVAFVLDGFSVDPDPAEFRNPPTPNVPPQYSLCRDPRVTDEERACLVYGRDPLMSSPTYSRTLTHLFWHVNAEAILQTGSFLLIHAGSLVAPGGAGVLLPADSGSGKTTLVGALLRSGFGYLSDEAAVIDPVRRLVHPFPKALTLKSGSFHLFPELAAQQAGEDLVLDTWHVQPEQLGASRVTSPIAARLVVAPRYDPEAPGVEIVPLTPGETALELARSCMNFRRYFDRALPVLADIARQARGYRMRFNDLDAAVATVHDLVSCSESDLNRKGS